MQQADWRAAYIALALAPLLACPMVYLLLPKSLDLGKQGKIAASGAGITLAGATRSHHFWLIAVAFLLVSAAVSGSIANFVPILTHRGLSATEAASMASIIGLAVVAGRIIAGLCLDRFWAPAVAAIMLSAPAVATFLLMQAGLPDAWLVGVAILIGLAAGAEFDLIAFLTSRYFGIAHYGKIYGWLYAAFIAGAAAGPPLFGHLYDRAASYAPALTLASMLFVAGSLLLLFLGRYPKLTVNHSATVAGS